LPRPDDVQLPLYAGFALGDDDLLGGLTFAKVRPGKLEFAGSVGAPSSTLFTGLKNGTALMKNALQAEQLDNWKVYIERLAKDFLSGRADVDPRDYPNTCKRCGLQTLCRIQENRIAQEEDESDGGGLDSTEAADE
jgi:hypothetical protein